MDEKEIEILEPERPKINWKLVTLRLIAVFAALVVVVAFIFAVETQKTRDDSATVVTTVGTTEATTTEPSMPETEPTYTEPEISIPKETEPVETIPTETVPSIPEITEPEVTEPVHTEPPAPTAPATTEMSDLELLACVIYSEAGGSCEACLRRVGDVVLNRVNDPRFPNTIYHVLIAPRQYGRFSWTGVIWPERASNPNEAWAVERAWRIAGELLSEGGQHSELYGAGAIWQAEFPQGETIVYHCGHYFGKS